MSGDALLETHITAAVAWLMNDMGDEPLGVTRGWSQNDGLFLPPHQRKDLPAVILEAQMATDPTFLLRLYAESARFLQQEHWERDWRVVVICPHRQLNFGALTPAREFVDHRVPWVELQPTNDSQSDEPLTHALSLLLTPEADVKSVANSLRQQASNNPLAAEVLPLIPAILLSRFNDRPIQEICAMGGITVEDFTQSKAYQEIFGQGVARGEARGRAAEAATVTLLQLNRCCGPLSDATTARIRGLRLEQLEALAEALLDFTGPADLVTWLSQHA